MEKFIAITGAQQVCPQYDGKSPHVGGSFLSGSSSLLLVNEKTVLRQGDQSQCKAGGPTKIQSGCSSLVIIEGMPLALLGSTTSHGGKIVSSNCEFIFSE